MIGAGGKAKKGLFYKVVAVSAEEVVLAGADGELRLSADAAVKAIRAAWALTYAACQGLTLPGRVRLLETDCPHFSIRHLYVGSSRATAAGLLEVS